MRQSPLNPVVHFVQPRILFILEFKPLIGVSVETQVPRLPYKPRKVIATCLAKEIRLSYAARIGE